MSSSAARETSTRGRRGAIRGRSERGAAVEEASRHDDDAFIDVGNTLVVAAGLEAVANLGAESMADVTDGAAGLRLMQLKRTWA